MHICKHGVGTGTKTITISLTAYEALLRVKKPGESFSDTILRLVKRNKGLMDLAGCWSDVNVEEIEDSLREVSEAWSKWTLKSLE
ncbi:MAG: antitoxin VapB family protein [Candidatus Korarchaeum sp.]|nr:antitoxin VapB family protein [Candidatus Korarchaeum sp.]MDW8036188.1 antitoxin VapB family protein [Candidatus Korarchaeum sp.]